MRFTIEPLILSKLYLGNHMKLRHHDFTNYILGTKKKTDIIDLHHTIKNIKNLTPIIQNIHLKADIFLIINIFSLKKEYIHIFELSNLYIINKWNNGWLTNFKLHILHQNILFLYYPDLIFDFNSKKNIASESNKFNIPIIRILDSNDNPKTFSNTIPSNNKSLISSFFYLYFIKKTCLLKYLLKIKHFKNDHNTNDYKILH